MANTTVKGKFNVVAENGDVQTIYPKTTGDQVLVDRSSNASVIPNDVANLQHIVNKMGSLALKSKVETSDFTTGTMIGVAGTGNDPCANLKANTAAGKIADALIVKNIESRVDTLENSNLVTVDELDAGLATKPDTEINDAVTSTSLTWSSKKLSDQLTELNSKSSLLDTRVASLITHNNDTEGNSELIDIRTGADGTVYESAGNAVREQFKNHNTEYIHNIMPKLIYGSVNTNTGTRMIYTSVTNRLVSNIIPNSYDYIISLHDDISISIFYYSNNNYNSYIKNSSWIKLNKGNKYLLENYPYIIITLRFNDDDSFISTVNEYFYLYKNNILDNDIKELKNIVNNNPINIIENVLNRKLKKLNYIENITYTYGDNLINNTKRWFLNKEFNKNEIITNISFYSIMHNYITFEIWEYIDNGILSKVKTYYFSDIHEGSNTIAVNYIVKKCAYIAFIQGGQTIPFQSSSNSSYLMYSNDISLETSTLQLSSLTKLNNFIPAFNISYDTYDNTNIMFIGKDMIYENIQDALDNITDDSLQNPYTLILLPSETPYSRFSMVRKLNETYKWENASPRYISLIGFNKAKCIIQSDSGEYDSPPSEILTNGIISNLTFKMTKNIPYSVPKKGGYSVHIDCRTLNDVGYTMKFENCDFYSETGPAVGIGLHTNADLTFINCHFESTSLLSYAPNEDYFNLTNYGCLFAHSSQLADAHNQKLTLQNCVGICKDGVKSLWVAKAGEFSSQTGDFMLTLLNNIFWNSNMNSPIYNISNDITCNPMNFGNNNI